MNANRASPAGCGGCCIVVACATHECAARCLQAGKVYVQDRLRESGDLVWSLLQRGAHFYVCGDAAHMAGSVELALLDIIAQHQVRKACGPG